MKLAALLCAALVSACAALEASPTPTAPRQPPPLATLPPPALGTPPRASGPTPGLPSLAPVPSPADTPPDSALARHLQQLVDDWREVESVPGAVLGLRLGDGETLVVASGRTDDGGGQPIEAQHRFRIGSITKTFIAVLMLQLAEEDLLDLDDRLAEHLPWAPHADELTLRQLLEQTSGLPDFGGLAAYRQSLLANPARVWEARETVELVAGLELDFEPGSRWAYSNTNYTLAGLVAEEVTGRDLAGLLRDGISQPAGLASTYLEGLEPAPPIETAGHYDLDGDGRAENVRMIPYTGLVTSGAAAGGLSSTARDTLEFAGALFGSELLGEAGLALLTTGSPVNPAYGLGLALFERDGRLLWGHAGALPGYSALLIHAPAEQVSVVALANQSGVELQALLEDALLLVEERGADCGRWSSRAAAAPAGALPARESTSAFCGTPSSPADSAL